MSTTTRAKPAATLHVAPERWIPALEARRASSELVLLDADDRAVVAVFLEPDGGLTRLAVPRAEGAATVLASPSAHGIREVETAERRLGRSGQVRWDPPAPAAPSVRGKGVFTFPLGPVRADVAESLGYNLAVMGDEILRLDLRPGFKFRGVADWSRGRRLEEAADVLERWTGTSTVAHALAFALAVEDALGLADEDPVGRSVVAELERVHSHLGDLAALAVSTGLPVPQMEYLHLREGILRLNHDLVGHRYLRGVVRPRGLKLADPPDRSRLRAASATVRRVREEASRIARDLSLTSSFLDRLVGAGRIPAPDLEAVRPVGPVGRASGRALDVRTQRPYAAYARWTVEPARAATGDAEARFRVKVAELERSLALLDALLAVWEPRGAPSPVAVDAADGAEGIGVVEAPRGLLATRVVLAGSPPVVRHVGVATPSARNWPAVPPAMANHNILQDFPIIDASFALSAAGWDG
ncbi:MAG: hydrogenase-3 subunit E [Actinomycetia bacterium]|nr:hydrogenase-3 subunit E [Actinomycetes bacterium]